MRISDWSSDVCSSDLKNPLRILDSKDEGDRRLVADAPLIQEYLTPAASDFFKALRDGLGAAGVPFTVSPRLVRGLDYYTHTAFEFTTEIGRASCRERVCQYV